MSPLWSKASNAQGRRVPAGARAITPAVANPLDPAERRRVPPWRSPFGRAFLLALGLAGAGIAAAFLGGGHIGDQEEPQPPRAVGEATKQVAATLTQFERALADG